MYKPPVTVSLVVIGIIGGFALGYMPAMSVVADAHRQINSSKVKPKRTIILRGIIRTIDLQTRYLVVQGVSPYSPNESAPFRIHIAENAALSSAPSTANNKNIFISPANRKRISIEGLIVGAPLIIQIGGNLGEFEAYSIVTVEHTD